MAASPRAPPSQGLPLPVVPGLLNRPGFGGDFLSWKDDLHAEAVPEPCSVRRSRGLPACRMTSLRAADRLLATADPLHTRLCDCRSAGTCDEYAFRAT